jgi:hypothetical protein
MSKIVFIETVSTFRHTYAIRLPDNEPVEYAFDDVTASFDSYNDDLSEVSQNHIAEDIFSHRVVTEEEYLELFDRENAYLKDWEPERKLQFIYDSLKHREDQVSKEVNWGPDVGREILSEDC